MSKLILDDGDRQLDLLATPGDGIWLVEWTPPLPTRENTYAESADSEGRSRVRSQAKNAEGNATVTVGATTEAEFWDAFDELQEMVESCHRQKGTLRYEPPRNGTPVWWNLESCQMTAIPQEGVWLDRLIQAGITFAFETKPWANLDPVVIFSGANFSGPIDYEDIPDVPGHVDGLVEFVLTDASSQARAHVEVAIQEDYDPANPEPLSLNLANGLTVSGYSGTSTTRSGSYSANVARATLSTAGPVVVCATAPQPHKRRWKVRCRVYPSAEHKIRLAWKVGDGPVTRERWITTPGAPEFYDLDLETINIEELPLGHSWTGYIEAYALTGTPTLDVDMIEMVPG